MLNLSAYVDPALQIAAVSELPQPYDDTFDDVNETGFAEILANLLQNTEKIQTDILPVEIPEAELDFNTISSNELKGDQEKIILNEEERAGVFETAEINAHESEEHEDYLNAYLSGAFAEVENLLNSAAAEIAEIDIPKPEAIIEKAIFNPQDDLKEEEQSIEVKLPDVLPAAEIAQSAVLEDSAEVTQEIFSEPQPAKVSLQTEKEIKDSALPVKENTEVFSAAQKPDSIKKPEAETKTRTEDTKSRRRDKFSVEVRDHRTEKDSNAVKMQRPFTAAENLTKRTETQSREITMELKLPVQGQTVWETKSGNNGSVSTAMENLLARELHQNFNGDIVRHASMALRDGGEGTIKLNLKPESLGNVKIRLEMSENKITGHIIVESKEALNAFRKELSALTQAFKDSGFASADLNLSLTSQGQETWEQDLNPFTSGSAALSYDDASVFGNDHTTVDVLIGRNNGSVNILV